MGHERVEVVVRCKNEMPWVVKTLERLGRLPVDVLFVDSGSTDGSLEAAEAAGARIVRIAPDAYVPGRVLNDAMRRTRGDIVAFVNADAIPQSDDAVELLVDACRRGAAAAYARQVPRANARAITRRDYDRSFPADPKGAPYRHFFSMAASAIRRDVWEALSFDEGLRYSEDVDWTFRLKALGLRVEYVPTARFEHSHDYDARGMYRRMYGEGVAHGAIFRVGREMIAKGLARPLVAQLVRDRLRTNVALRVAAEIGRFRGRRDSRSSYEPSESLAKSAGPPRFTLTGDAAGEKAAGTAIDAALGVIEREVGSKTVATVLLGGFACGEGAIEMRDGVARLHNDLDFVVVTDTRRQAAALRKACAAVGEHASEKAGVTVDVWPACRDEVAHPAGRLLWIDAVLRGARVLRGDHDVLASTRGLSARSVSSDEIGRLIANRATGVALTRLAFEGGALDARAARHVAKSWLAIGDALLLLVDRYSPRLDSRREALERLAACAGPEIRALSDAYARAVEFRRDPSAFSATEADVARDARAQWQVIAALEAHRLGATKFSDAEAYADSPQAIFPDMGDVKALARALGGVRAALDHRVGWRHARRHPRDTLARVSVVLAYDEDRAAARAWATEALHADSSDPRDLTIALERLRDVAA